MRLKAIVAGVLLTAFVGSAWAASLSPRVAGWERYFKLEWDTGLRRDQPIVSGYITNEGFAAQRIQLLVDTLDDKGEVVGQKIDWFHGMLTPGMRAYFEVPVSERAPAYRVSVFAFEWVQMGGGDHR
ncbi:MAG: hypothetical protein HY216_03415 [Candidatus Rokubacteria bacterium]|nr:hypothetical protein [Candidatus Rokubacteria bacterium]